MQKWLQKYNGILRSLRLTYIIYNIANIKKLVVNKAYYERYNIKKYIWQSIAHKDIRNKIKEIPWLDNPNIKSQTISFHPDFKSFSPAIQQQLLQWPANGFMIIPSLFINDVESINSEIDNLKTHQKVDFNFTGKKIMDAWKHGKVIDDTFKNNTILQILQFIFQKQVIPFQTINFIYGSEQKPHSDSVHMTTEPLGYLAAIWIALEDVKIGSGELIYYKGSHKLPYLMSEHYNSGNNIFKLGENSYKQYEYAIGALIKEEKLTPSYFYAKKGDVFIWHANLLHGGSIISDKKQTRKSMVAHYYADEVLCYHEISQRPAILPSINQTKN